MDDFEMQVTDGYFETKELFYCGVKIAETLYKVRDNKINRSICMFGFRGLFGLVSGKDFAGYIISRGEYGLMIYIHLELDKYIHIINNNISDRYHEILEFCKSMDTLYDTINAEVGFDRIFDELATYKKYRDIHWPPRFGKDGLFLYLRDNEDTHSKLEMAIGKDSCISRYMKVIAETCRLAQ